MYSVYAVENKLTESYDLCSLHCMLLTVQCAYLFRLIIMSPAGDGAEELAVVLCPFTPTLFPLSLAQVYTGGLGSYALLVMLMAHLQVCLALLCSPVSKHSCCPAVPPQRLGRPVGVVARPFLKLPHLLTLPALCCPLSLCIPSCQTPSLPR